MIKLRDASGTEIELPAQPFFIEVCDQDGKVGLLFYEQEDYIAQVVPGTPEAERYSRVYDREFCEITDLRGR